MATLYLVEQNTILRKQGNRLLLCKRPPANRRYSAVLQGDILLDLPAADVDHVMLFGNIQVTTQALHFLLQKGVELALFRYGGELLGQLTPPLAKNITLRTQQFRRADDAQFTLQFSRQVVGGKISNALNFLRQFQANHPGIFLPGELEAFSRSLQKIPAANTLESLLGLEGAAAAHYFNLFGKIIRPPWSFSGRNKRPPKDPVNAVLSFGYVVVGAQIQALLDGIGLDPYLGFYHQLAYGRPGLALDILEEFRHPLVDRLAITLFNKNILQEADFFKPSSTGEAGGGVYLSTSGKRKFFTHYEKMLGEFTLTAAAPPARKGYYPLFQQQISRLIRAIQDNASYEPFQIP
jgi:CRISPR-associated protein Cas1